MGVKILLEELIIRGYQSHVNSVFKFCPGLNVITGPSGSGKTAVIRTIRWVAQGEPQGDAFTFTVRNPAGEIVEQADYVEVGIKTTDNLITKKRRKGKTTFNLATMAEPMEQASTPPEVAEALGMGVTNFGDFEAALNFAYQLGAPFLISEPPSAGAKVLGKLAGTEVVDLAVKAVSKDTYAARQDKQRAEKDEAARIIDLQEYADLDDLVAQLEACEFLVVEMDRAAARVYKLGELEVSYEGIIEVLDYAEAQVKRLAVVPQLVEGLAAVETQQARIDNLRHYEQRYTESIKIISAHALELARLAETEKAATQLAALEVAVARTQKLNNLAALYLQHTDVVNRADKTLAQVVNLDVAVAELNTLESRVGRPEKLRILQAEYQAAQARITRCSIIINQYTGVPQAAELLTRVQIRADRIARLKDLAAQYRIKDNTVKDAADRLQRATLAVDEGKKRLADLWEGLEVCPLCEQPVSKGACC